MDNRAKLGSWMRMRRDQMEREEGRSYDNNRLTWEIIAERMNRRYTTVVRWKDGKNLPQNYDDIQVIASVMGDGVYEVLGIPARLPEDLDQHWKDILCHRDDPVVVEGIIEIARRLADRRKRDMDNKLVTNLLQER